MTRLPLYAVGGYTTGVALGLILCWATWARATHEHNIWKGWTR